MKPTSLYPHLRVTLEKYDDTSQTICYVEGIALDEDSIGIWFLGFAEEDRQLELQRDDYKRVDIRLHTSAED